jgi:nicotinate-nucleotide adenylyltransferase
MSSPAIQPQPSQVIGIMGGSFDPPHMGHLIAARWARHHLGPAATILIIPSGDHPFGKRLTPAEHRLAMCALTFGEDSMVICRIEIERAAKLTQPTYTIDTLRELRRLHPGASLRLILGTDVMTETARWRAWDEVVATAPPLWVPRVGFQEIAGSCVEADYPADGAGLPPRPPGISSRELRQMLREGRDVSAFLAPGVLDYIRDHRLYPMQPGA